MGAWGWVKDKVGGALGLTDAEGTEDLVGAKDAAKRQREALEAELTNFQPRQAPTQSSYGTDVTAAGPVGVERVRALRPAMPSAVSTIGVTADGVNAQRVGSAAQVGPATAATTAIRERAATPTQVQVGAAAPALGGRHAGAGVAQAAAAAPVVIDASPQAEFRAGQSSLAQRLQDMLDGKATSAAGLQTEQNLDRNVRQQLALIAGAAGAQGMALRKQSTVNTADLASQAAADGAILRAKEAADQTALLSSVLTQGRGQDIGLATDSAKLKQEANLTNAKLKTDVSQGNANRLTDVNTAQMSEDGTSGRFVSAQEQKRLEFEAQLEADRQGRVYSTESELAGQDAGRADTMTRDVAGRTDAININQAGRQDVISVGDADRKQSADQFTAGANTDVQKFNADGSLRSQEFNTEAGMRTREFTAEMDLRSQTFNAQMSLDAQKFNTDQLNEIAKFTAQLSQARNANDLQSVLQVMQLDDAAKRNLMASWFAANGQVMGAAEKEMAEDVRSDGLLADTAVRIGTALKSGAKG